MDGEGGFRVVGVSEAGRTGPSPSAAIASLPVSMGTGASNSRSCAVFSQFLHSLKPGALLLWSEGMDFRYHFCWSLRSASSDIQIFGVFLPSTVSGQGTFIELWTFYCLYIKGQR